MIRSILYFIIVFVFFGTATAQDFDKVEVISWTDLDQDRMSHFIPRNVNDNRIVWFNHETIDQISDPYVQAQARTVSNQIKHTLKLSFLNGGLLGTQNEDEFLDGYSGHKVQIGFANSRGATATYYNGKPILVIDPNWLGITDEKIKGCVCSCLLYTSPSPRDRQKSRMPSSA